MEDPFLDGGIDNVHIARDFEELCFAIKSSYPSFEECAIPVDLTTNSTTGLLEGVKKKVEYTAR